MTSIYIIKILSRYEDLCIEAVYLQQGHKLWKYLHQTKVYEEESNKGNQVLLGFLPLIKLVLGFEIKLRSNFITTRAYIKYILLSF